MAGVTARPLQRNPAQHVPGTTGDPSLSPEDIVERQLDAYNARDLERFLAHFLEIFQCFHSYLHPLS